MIEKLPEKKLFTNYSYDFFSELKTRKKPYSTTKNNEYTLIRKEPQKSSLARIDGQFKIPPPEQ